METTAAAQTVPESSGHEILSIAHLADVDFLEVRVLNSSGIVSSRLGVSKDGADEVVYVLHGSSRAHNTVSRRELSLSNVVRHVIQGRSRRCSGDGG